MDESYETRKVRGDKIALLGLFALSLLTAYLMTVSKSALVLSEPIELSHTGLALSVPSGNGWLSEKQWKYHENAFTLSSVFAPEHDKPDAIVRCQYLFTADRTSPQMRFEQKASGVDGTIVKTGRTQKGVLTIDWVQIKKPQTLLNLFFGTVDLPGNRRLNIEVPQVRGNANIAEKAFKRITESLNFNDNRLLEAGGEIVAKIKSKGLTSFLDNQSQQVFFLIKTVRQRTELTIGFTMDVLVSTRWNVEPDIQAAGFLYTRVPYSHLGHPVVGQEQVTSFQSDNSLDGFVWKSETSGAAGRSGTEIIADKNDVITIRKFDVQPEEKSYQLSPAAIPNIFLQQVLSQMLDSGEKETVVDIIRPDGTIAPTFISRIESHTVSLTGEDTAADEGAGYILEVGFLCEGGFSEQVYLDGKKQISKKVFSPFLLSQESRGASVLERVAQEDIIREFPERADFILQKSNPLEPDSSQ